MAGCPRLHLVIARVAPVEALIPVASVQAVYPTYQIAVKPTGVSLANRWQVFCRGRCNISPFAVLVMTLRYAT